MSGYTLADLQDVDERCRQIADDELGFDVPEVIYHLVAPEEVYFAAANGLPARYSSARWGAQFDDAYGRYQRGQERIYELIFNTRPVHAYLMEGNSLVAQTLVIAHCLGHGYVFENNEWLGAVDREIMSRVISAAERIADYMGAHGRDRVEDFLDSCHAIAIHQPQAQLIRKAVAPKPEHRSRPFDVLFPEEVSADRERVVAERAALRSRFPREPEADLLSFIEANARGLEDWQRDVISIVHTEQSYFLPQMRTKILNEGWASYWHSRIVRDLELSDREYVEFAQMHAAVLAPSKESLNPYHVGLKMLEDLERRWDAPGPEEVARLGRAPGGGRAKLFEVRELESDVGFLRNYLTRDLVEALDLYIYKVEGDKLVVVERDWEKIRDMLVGSMTNFGVPYVLVEDGDHKKARELYLRHAYEGREIDLAYAQRVLRYLHAIWGRPVHLETVLDDQPTVLSFDGQENTRRAAAGAR